MDKLHISVAAEKLFHLGPIAITNSILTSFVVMGILLAIIILSQNKTSKFYTMIEFAIEQLYNFIRNILGEATDKIFPLLLAFFMFILFSNWIGLLPGVGSIGLNHETSHGHEFLPLLRSPSADLNTTIALALVSVIIIQFLSIKAHGIGGYIKKFINFSNPINFFVGILEAVSELAKVLSFSFRLFGNIFAGEVLLMVAMFLIPYLLPVPFLILEIFVGFIQALVFTMLTTIFLVVATAQHGQEH